MNKEYLNNLKTKKIAVLGFGLEGKTLSNFFAENDFKNVSIFDEKLANSNNIYRVEKVAEFKYEFLKDFDIVYISPGISPYKNNLSNLNLSSQTDLWFNLYKNVYKIGITGTKGKSTTSSMLNHALKKLGKKTSLAGNIGKPLLEIKNVEELDYIIIELSSYQLYNFNHKINIAIFLNLYEEHLSWHKTFGNYKNDKLNIIKKNPDFLFINENFKELAYKSLNSYFFKEEINPITTSKNLVASVLEHLKIDKKDINSAIESFIPLPHRLETLGIYKNNILIVDDSLATIPKAVITSINNFSKREVIVLMGGLDRGVSFNELRNLPENVFKVIAFGEVKAKLKKNIDNEKLITTNSFENAIKIARETVKPNQVILFSPSAPSSPPFNNYKERSEFFKKMFF